MIQQAYTRTDLTKQEAMIEAWKKQNGWNDNQPAPVAKTPEKGNAFLFASTEAEKQSAKQRRADYKAQRENKKIPANANSDMMSQRQAEYWEKYQAQKDGNPDPVYYYTLYNNQIKRKKRVNPIPEKGKYQSFKGKYGKLKGSNTGNQILWLLGQHEYIDVDALVFEHNFNRQTFLNTAKQLEKAGLLKMIKIGIKLAYLERVA